MPREVAKNSIRACPRGIVFRSPRTAALLRFSLPVPIPRLLTYDRTVVELTADSTVAACDEGPDKKKEKQKDKKKSATSADSRADEASAESADGDSSVDSGGSVDSVGIQIVTPGGTLIAAAADRSDQQVWSKQCSIQTRKI